MATDALDNEAITRVGSRRELHHRVHTLGHVRLRHHHSGEIIFTPTPSADPNDPLNWSYAFKYYVTVLLCLAMVACNFLAAGPSVAIVDIAIDFAKTPGDPGTYLGVWIPKVAYFFTATSLSQGVGNFIWMPLINKYGRRPVYVGTFTAYTFMALWSGLATSYASELAARILMGLFAGSGECLAPLTIADIFFLHERGTIMACYTAALSSGVALGIIIAGLITINLDWRFVYYITVALIGSLTILIVFTFPETCYNRAAVPLMIDTATDDVEKAEAEADANATQVERSEQQQDFNIPDKHTFIQNMRMFTTVYTKESLWSMFIRPLGLLLVPQLLWTTLVLASNIGFLVAISSNFASAFETTYGFLPWQSGLCFIAGLVGNALGIVWGGMFGDFIADWGTKRNDGIREPEMRLPALAICLITSPLGLILYGLGIQNHYHWMVPTLGLGLLSFSVTNATTVPLVYSIDSFRPVAGEVAITLLGFKACFGFLLAFYTNPWIENTGYIDAFSAMGAISGFFIALLIPFYFYGKRLRHACMSWRFYSFIDWKADRETGE